MRSRWGPLPAGFDHVRKSLGKNHLKAFGRFRTVRQVYSRVRRLKRPARMRFHPTNVESRNLTISASSETYFEGLSVDDCVQDLKLHGISQAFRLPEPVADNILSYAQRTRFHTENRSRDGLIADFQQRRDSGLVTPARAICTDIAGSSESISIVRDCGIHQVATRYLGYQPQICEAYIEALFRMAPAAQETDYLPYNYHYDIPGFGFIAFFFYLHAVDEQNGAHVVIRQSHNNKRLGLLLRSGQSAGKLVPMYYDRDLELTVTGPKGHGFAEDLYSFHKVYRPIREDRLSFQIRYY